MNMKLKDYIFLFFIAVVIIGIFTLIDYYVHGLSEEYSVPGYYYRNKMIFGVVYCFLGLLILRRLGLWMKAFVLSIAISILLQARYYLEGYPREFVFEFMLYHFLMLVPSFLIVFWAYDKLFKQAKIKKNLGKRKH